MLEDRLLIWRFKSGSTEAFRRIYEKYIDDLLTLATNLLSDGAAGEDVVQDVFISFVQSVDKFHLTGSLKSYLATCVANRSRDYLRKRRRQQAAALEEAGQLTVDVDGPVQLAVRSEELQRLGRALTELPHEQREVVVLRLQAGLKFKAIAKLQNTSTKTALSRYRYGLDKLRSLLDGEMRQ
ncbi:MAG: RNA polymerase sigma factor [Planctomycetota bacterium]|jgi:RNA polymerase sigma-70 factor (ECF subfamily)